MDQLKLNCNCCEQQKNLKWTVLTFSWYKLLIYFKTTGGSSIQFREKFKKSSVNLSKLQLQKN